MTKQYASTEIPMDSRGVPLKYQDYADTFTLKSESPAPLPPHRPYDLEIEFLRDAEGKELPLPRPGKNLPTLARGGEGTLCILNQCSRPRLDFQIDLSSRCPLFLC